ncbi:MAG: ABC transporter permease subunit [Anaerolineales bacterium]|nr:ABC transporter permease subunit [Anaerolineales bacterium]
MEAVSVTTDESKRIGPSIFQRTSRLARKRPMFVFGIVIVLVYFLVALIGPFLLPYGPTETNPQETYQPPSREHLFGTDKFGRDVFTRVVYATRLDLTIAASVALSAFVIGSFIGGLSGYYGGRIDDVVMRIVDVMFAFPAFILAMAITGVLGDSIPNVIIAIAIAYIPYFIRLTRSEMLKVRTHQYADAAVSVGNPRWRVMSFHLLPNALMPALVQVALVFGWAILDAAGLAFLGLGITPPTAEWGVLVSEGAQRIITGEWWVWLWPGLAIVIAAFAFSLIGDGLRDIIAHEESG